MTSKMTNRICPMNFSKNILAIAIGLLPLFAVAQGTPPSSLPTTTYTYDAVGHVMSVVKPSGRSSQASWDSFDRLTLIAPGTPVSGGATGTVAYGYDLQDSLVGVTDPRGLITAYTRDGFGQATTQSSPDSGSTSYVYDNVGNLLSRSTPSGQVESYTYDAADRVRSKTVTQAGLNPALTYSVTYGTTGVEAGRLTSISAPGQQLAYTHEIHGRVTAVSQTVGAQAFNVAYGYASGGLVSSITYPSGRVVSLVRDTIGHVTSISTTAGGVTTPLLSDGTYTPFGEPAGWSFGASGSGVSVARGYDLNGRLTSVSLPTGVRQYAYDVDDRITAITDPVLGGATYTYDDQDRLTSASTFLGAWSYQYDANGNRTAIVSSGVSYSATIDIASNRATAVAGPVAQAITFNADGNSASVAGGSSLVACGSPLLMKQSADGELNNASPFWAVMSATGQRLQKTDLPCAGSGVTNFVYDLAGHLIGEYDGTGGVLSETVWLDDIPVGVYKDGTSTPNYIWADNLRTPRAVTNASGQLLWQWDGEPFGATAANSNPSGQGAFVYNLRFPGQYYDVETGYHHNGWREYDPTLGRYVQSDPIGLYGGLNTYSYVGGNPLAFSDFYGLDRWGDTMGLATHIYITQSSNTGKAGPPMGAAGNAVNGDVSLTFPANSFPDPSYGNPGIVDGTYYGVYGDTAHLFPSVGERGPGVVLNNNGPIPTLGPNPAHGGQSFADGIHLHCQNFQEHVSRQRGSAGCLTVQGDYCQAVFDIIKASGNKNVIVHLVRN